MRFTSDPTNTNIIRSCTNGAIQLRDSLITSHLIISADSITTDWNPPQVEELSINDLSSALELKPEVLLLGTGVIQRFPNISVLTELMQQGIAIEVMHTHAACRTFNVLVSEQRAVVAALINESSAQADSG